MFNSTDCWVSYHDKRARKWISASHDDLELTLNKSKPLIIALSDYYTLYSLNSITNSTYAFIIYILFQQLIGRFIFLANVRPSINIFGWHTFTEYAGCYFGLMKYVTRFRKYVFHHSTAEIQLFEHVGNGIMFEWGEQFCSTNGQFNKLLDAIYRSGCTIGAVLRVCTLVN